MQKRNVLHPRRRRGTAYILTLAITSMLITLGITAVQIARAQLERNTLEHDLVAARESAFYAQDYIHKVLDGDTAWRSEAVNGRWASLAQLHGVSLSYAYVDEIDGDMTNDATQPFMLYTLAVAGNARRVYKVELVPDKDGKLKRNLDRFEQIPFEDF